MKFVPTAQLKHKHLLVLSTEDGGGGRPLRPEPLYYHIISHKLNYRLTRKTPSSASDDEYQVNLTINTTDSEGRDAVLSMQRSLFIYCCYLVAIDVGSATSGYHIPLLLRTQVMRRRQESESIEVAFDME